MKNNIFKFFSCNFFKLFKDNFRNNEVSKYDRNIYDFVIKRELLVIAFVVLRFFSLFVGVNDFYSAVEHSFFVFFKDVIFECFLWVAFFSFLSFLTILFNNKRVKCKYFLFLILLYLLSNLFYFLMIAFFVSIFMLNFVVGLAGILVSICIIVFNMIIVVEFIETNLKC